MRKQPITRFVRFLKSKKQKKKRKSKKIKGLYFKVLIFMVEIHGIACVTFSYVLAYLDKMAVCESVSSTIVTEIIAPIVVYGTTKTIENIFEKNKLPFSTPIQAISDDVEDDPQKER